MAVAGEGRCAQLEILVSGLRTHCEDELARHARLVAELEAAVASERQLREAAEAEVLLSLCAGFRTLIRVSAL